MPNSRNLLLASLSASDAAALQPHLKAVHLEHEKILFEAGGEVRVMEYGKVEPFALETANT